MFEKLRYAYHVWRARRNLESGQLYYYDGGSHARVAEAHLNVARGLAKKLEKSDEKKILNLGSRILIQLAVKSTIKN